MPFYLGTAGWSVPKQHLPLFPDPSKTVKQSHLERYASRLNCVEINSSFHRPHRRATWERWAQTTPCDFRFAVKMPRAITHTEKLENSGATLLEFFEAVQGLGEKLGPVLVQLPPKLPFEFGTANEFFATLREIHPGPVVLEPRHPSWFTISVDRLLKDFEIARAAADPPKGSDLAAKPGGWSGLRHWRLHGSPRTYYSSYEDPWLKILSEQLQGMETSSAGLSKPKETWVIFDNTALGHATANAVFLRDALAQNAPT